MRADNNVHVCRERERERERYQYWISFPRPSYIAPSAHPLSSFGTNSLLGGLVTDVRKLPPPPKKKEKRKNLQSIALGSAYDAIAAIP